MKRTSKLIIKHLENTHDNNYQWKFKPNSYQIFDCSEDGFIESLNELSIKGYISYKLNSVHNDLKYGGTIKLLKPLITHKEDMLHKWFVNVYDFVKFLIPVIISVIALIISIIK